VPVAALSAHGYGEMFPGFPNGTEEQMVADRRVLVVRKM
jgi:outer membrane protein OmpA-like peptidoglycan-associated protein